MKRYTDWMKVWQTKRKYKGTVGIGCGMRMYEKDGVLFFHPNQYDTVLGVMTQDDIFTVRAKYDNLKAFKGKFNHLIGVNVYSHKRTKTMVNTLKACEQGVNYWPEEGQDGPYFFVTGLQYKIDADGHARCVNKDEAVQKVRRLKPDVQHRVTQALAPLTAACKVLARMDAYITERPTDRWWTAGEAIRTKMDALSLEDVNAEALSPQDVITLGWTTTSGAWRLHWQKNDPAAKQVIERAVENGLRLLREYWYARLDGYVIVTKPD